MKPTKSSRIKLTMVSILAADTSLSREDACSLAADAVDAEDNAAYLASATALAVAFPPRSFKRTYSVKGGR